MTRQFNSFACAAVAAALFSGCATNEVAKVRQEPREAITYAATAKYPGNAQKSDRVQVTAVNDDGAHEVILYNLSNQSLPETSVWVNGAFVTRIDGIPPRGSVTVKHSELLEAGPGTGDVKRLDQSVNRVELQTPDGLFAAGGPAQKR